MYRKLGLFLIAILVSAGVSVGVSGTAVAHPSTHPIHARSVLPQSGHYSGHDGHGRMVTFIFTNGHIEHFALNGQVIVRKVRVTGSQFHHTCDSSTGKCIRGHWSRDHEVFGYWNDPSSGHDVVFEARRTV